MNRTSPIILYCKPADMPGDDIVALMPSCVTVGSVGDFERALKDRIKHCESGIAILILKDPGEVYELKKLDPLLLTWRVVTLLLSNDRDLLRSANTLSPRFIGYLEDEIDNFLCVLSNMIDGKKEDVNEMVP